jgi:hypothetical protein
MRARYLLTRTQVGVIYSGVHGVASIVNQSFRARCADDAAGFGFFGLLWDYYSGRSPDRPLRKVCGLFEFLKVKASPLS